MIGWRRTTACERASQWLSLDLDGELSEVEQAGLTRHLERCERCRLRSAELAGMTALLRSAPLVDPTRPVVLPAPRRQRARLASRIGLAVAVGAMVAAIAAMLTNPSPTGLLGSPSSQALHFVSQREQIRFAQNKTLQMEPLRAVVLAQASAASVPANPRQALR
jgi:predicted anti-sigma-YlaC factor YlaD